MTSSKIMPMAQSIILRRDKNMKIEEHQGSHRLKTWLTSIRRSRYIIVP